jgi:hypothetical protein
LEAKVRGKGGVESRLFDVWYQMPVWVAGYDKKAVVF